METNNIERNAEAVLFEFYRIIPRDNNPRSGVEPKICTPSCQRVSKTNLQATLAMICAEAYGEGDFIALEVGGASEEQAQGLPIAYWLIRVKPNKYGMPCREAKQIALDDKDHEGLSAMKRRPALIRASEEDEQREREAGAAEEETGLLVRIDHDQGYDYRYDPAIEAIRNYKKDDEAWQQLWEPDRAQRRMYAHIMVSSFFDLMPNPQAGEGMRPHDFIRLRMSDGAGREEIINDLTSRSGPFHLSEKQAKTAYNSVMRGKQQMRKKEKEKEKAPIFTSATKKKAVKTRGKR
jgi:hypothetical protein